MPEDPSPMELPSDLDLPFFAYGVFRPGELAFLRVAHLCRIATRTELRGECWLRDGLPLLNLDAGGAVEGDLLHFKRGRERDAYQLICDLEPQSQYRWEVVKLRGARVNVLVGRSVTRGSIPPQETEWSGGRNDPLFKEALEIVQEGLDDNHGGGLKGLFRLEMAYMLLWSAMERYASLRYHLRERAVEKVARIAEEPAFAAGLKDCCIGQRPRLVYRADRPANSYGLDPSDPKGCLNYYYQVRSNMVHRGKAADQDYERVHDSLAELLPIFRATLETAFKESEAAAEAVRVDEDGAEDERGREHQREEDEPDNRRPEGDEPRRYLGIDFSGDQAQWEATTKNGNVWIAEAELTKRTLTLVSLGAVQQLTFGAGLRPFAGLAALLGNAAYSVAGIDAPFSLPTPRMTKDGSLLSHADLLELADNIDTQGRDFPRGEALVAEFAPGLGSRGVKEFRVTETVWGVNTRSTIWNGPRGGAPMTAACLKLLARAHRPMWPWDTTSPGRIAEAFPAAQLRHWKLAHDRYDGDGDDATRLRTTMLAGIERGLEARGFKVVIKSSQRHTIGVSADALDAFVCTLAALAVDIGETAHGDRRKDATESAVEGWIAVYN